MIIFVNIFICSIVVFNLGFCDKTLSAEISKVLKSYQNSGYNKDVRPDYGEKLVIVNISMHIKDISSVSETEMDFTADFFLRQTWNDERLVYNQTNGLKQLIVGADFIKKIWIPDTYFVNSKQTSLHTSTNLETNSFLRIKPNGDVYYSLRYFILTFGSLIVPILSTIYQSVTVVAVCQMNLKNFPMDTQICNLEIESYGYSTDEVEYFWMERVGSDIDADISLPNFNIACHSNEKIYQIFSTGNYSRLQHRIVFSRSLGYYLNQVYIPAILIVIISWIPFWLDRDDSHARVGLGVTTVLTMTTLVTQTNAAMPKISYMKSLDIYLEMSFGMVFASLIQYAIVGYFTAKNFNILSDSERRLNLEKNRYIKRNPSKIDLHSRWAFPLLYILFNICYWSVYLSLSQLSFCRDYSQCFH